MTCQAKQHVIQCYFLGASLTKKKWFKRKFENLQVCDLFSDLQVQDKLKVAFAEGYAANVGGGEEKKKKFLGMTFSTVSRAASLSENRQLNWRQTVCV